MYVLSESGFCLGQTHRHTFNVSSMDRNFLWSPISMALLMIGSSVFTASSMGIGGTFSPPAVMISSGEVRPGYG